MLPLEKYIINVHTAAFIPHFNEVGALQTLVIEKDRYFMVKMAPSALIDFNLRYYGSSMRGAKDGTKECIGSVKVPPIAINETQGIYWLSSDSSKMKHSVWIAGHFILKFKKNDLGMTDVFLTNGFVIQVEELAHLMDRRLDQTRMLQFVIDRRTKLMAEKIQETPIVYFKKDPKNANYEIEERK